MDNYYVFCSDFNSDNPLDPTSKAVVKLPIAIDAKDGYEVALLEAHVCVAWSNVTRVAYEIEKFDPVSGLVAEKFMISIKDTLDSKLETLFEKLNQALEKHMIDGEEIVEWARLVVVVKS
jgi:hypothetical protein